MGGTQNGAFGLNGEFGLNGVFGLNVCKETQCGGGSEESVLVSREDPGQEMLPYFLGDQVGLGLHQMKDVCCDKYFKFYENYTIFFN